jgi:hypothetical protein
MLSVKVATSIIALVLLTPFVASFWMMATYRPRTDSEMQESLDKALAEAKTDVDERVTPDYPGVMAVTVEIVDQMTLSILPHRLWLLYPRRWVGIAGLAATGIVGTLLVLSAWIPGQTFTGSYGKGGAPFAEPTEQLVEPGRAIIPSPDQPDGQAKQQQ